MKLFEIYGDPTGWTEKLKRGSNDLTIEKPRKETIKDYINQHYTWMWDWLKKNVPAVELQRAMFSAPSMLSFLTTYFIDSSDRMKLEMAKHTNKIPKTDPIAWIIRNTNMLPQSKVLQRVAGALSNYGYDTPDIIAAFDELPANTNLYQDPVYVKAIKSNPAQNLNSLKEELLGASKKVYNNFAHYAKTDTPKQFSKRFVEIWQLVKKWLPEEKEQLVSSHQYNPGQNKLGMYIEEPVAKMAQHMVDRGEDPHAVLELLTKINIPRWEDGDLDYDYSSYHQDGDSSTFIIDDSKSLYNDPIYKKLFPEYEDDDNPEEDAAYAKWVQSQGWT